LVDIGLRNSAGNGPEYVEFFRKGYMGRIAMRALIICLLALTVLLGGFTAGGQAAPHESFPYPNAFAASDGSLISGEERQAITVMVEGFKAYNSDDPTQIKRIHWWLQPVKDRDVTAALVRSGIYRLHGVKIMDASADRLKIVALFSREVPDAQGSLISFNHGVFTLQYKNGVWGIIGYQAMDDKDIFTMIDTWAKAARHYGVNDLSLWSGLNE
jgi:hypothetical protein